MILVSPSAVSWQAIGSTGELPDTGSWTHRGQPVPWVPVATGVLMRQIIRNAWTVGRDITLQRPSLLRLRPAYEESLAAVGLLNGRGSLAADPSGASPPSAGSGDGPPAGAVLDATKVECPLLMLSGIDDQLWPSVPMAAMLAAQRSAAGLDHDDQLVAFHGAGHLIRLGLLPTDSPWTNGIAFGGTREGLAHAQSDATGRVLEFLGAPVTVR